MSNEDIFKSLPSYGAEAPQAPVKEPVVEAETAPVEAPVEEPKPKKKAAPKADEKPVDPALKDYTFGYPIGEIGKYKLPNGTIVETN